MKEIKDRISIALKEKGKTAKELSQMTGIPISSISQYMSGHVKPKQDRIYLICKALRINEAWLMGYDVPMDKTVQELKEEKLNLTDEEIEFINSFRVATDDCKLVIKTVFEMDKIVRKNQNKMRDFVNKGESNNG